MHIYGISVKMAWVITKVIKVINSGKSGGRRNVKEDGIVLPNRYGLIMKPLPSRERSGTN